MNGIAKKHLILGVVFLVMGITILMTGTLSKTMA